MAHETAARAAAASARRSARRIGQIRVAECSFIEQQDTPMQETPSPLTSAHNKVMADHYGVAETATSCGHSSSRPSIPLSATAAGVEAQQLQQRQKAKLRSLSQSRLHYKPYQVNRHSTKIVEQFKTLEVKAFT